MVDGRMVRKKCKVFHKYGGGKRKGRRACCSCAAPPHLSRLNKPEPRSSERASTQHVDTRKMAGDPLTPEVLLAVGIAVVVAIVSLVFLARPKGKDADLLDQLRSARVEIRDLLDKINCGTSLLPPWRGSHSAAVLAMGHCVTSFRVKLQPVEGSLLLFTKPYLCWVRNSLLRPSIMANF